MKTTLDLNEQLLASAKGLAARQRTSLTRLIEEGLQLRLRAKPADPSGRRRRLPVFKGRGGLVAGVQPLRTPGGSKVAEIGSVPTFPAAEYCCGSIRALNEHEGGMPMQEFNSGSTGLTALIMFVVDASKPFSEPATSQH